MYKRSGSLICNGSDKIIIGSCIKLWMYHKVWSELGLIILGPDPGSELMVVKVIFFFTFFSTLKMD